MLEIKKQVKNYKILLFIYSFFIYLCLMFLFSCGAGPDYYVPDNIYEGVFIDSPVENLVYETASLKGETDNKGFFKYRLNEYITFYIGKIKIGRTIAKPEISPIDLVEDASSVGNQAVTNICRLLQSLDIDNYPSNGITLSEHLKNSLEDEFISIDFNQSFEDFENDTNIEQLFNKLIQDGIIHNDHVLLSNQEAQKHFRKTLYGELNHIKISTDNENKISGGEIINLKAIGVFDKTSIDITDQVEWYSSDNTVAIVSNSSPTKGNTEALFPGQTSIEAKIDGVYDSFELTVKEAEIRKIQIAPDNPKMPVNTNIMFTAIGFYSDGTIANITNKANWSTSDDTIAVIDNSIDNKGLLLSKIPGKTQVIVELNSVFDETFLIVTDTQLKEIEISPTDSYIPNGLEYQYTAKGLYWDNSIYDITKQVSWSSSVPFIATISNNLDAKGLVKAISIGTTTIQAEINDITSTSNLIITDAALHYIRIEPDNFSIPLLFEKQLTAIGVYSDDTSRDITKIANWTTFNPSIAIVSNENSLKGMVIPVSQGTTTIQASLDQVLGSANVNITSFKLESVQISPSNYSLPHGLTYQFLATGIFEDQSIMDITSEVTWASSNEEIARISNTKSIKGLLNTIKSGTVNISATYKGKTGFTNFTVTPSVLLSIRIDPLNPSLSAGSNIKLTALGFYSDNLTYNISNLVQWSSDDTSIATIQSINGVKGYVYGLNSGGATITAKIDDHTISSYITVY